MRTKRMLRGTTSVQPFDCTLQLTTISLCCNGQPRAGLLSRGFLRQVNSDDFGNSFLRRFTA